MENSSSVDTLRKRWAAFREKIPVDPPLLLQPTWPQHGDPVEELVKLSAFSPSVTVFWSIDTELSSLATVKTKSYRSSRSAQSPLLRLRQRRFFPTADFVRLRDFRRAEWWDSCSEKQEDPCLLVWSQDTLMLASSHACFSKGKQFSPERAVFWPVPATHPFTSACISAFSRALGDSFWCSPSLHSLSLQQPFSGRSCVDFWLWVSPSSLQRPHGLLWYVRAFPDRQNPALMLKMRTRRTVSGTGQAHMDTWLTEPWWISRWRSKTSERLMDWSEERRCWNFRILSELARFSSTFWLCSAASSTAPCSMLHRVSWLTWGELWSSGEKWRSLRRQSEETSKTPWRTFEKNVSKNFFLQQGIFCN